MIKEKIAELLEKSIKNLQKKGVFGKCEIPKIIIDSSKENKHGDYSTNLALILAKNIKKSPLEIADNLIREMKGGFFPKIENINGFINFFVSEEYLQNQVKEILKQKEKFGSKKSGKGVKINVEFISANPTGPLTLGNGRGGFCGDVLANVLQKAGNKITREYYLNDRGEQIVKLGHSILGDAQAVYKGEYIDKIRGKIKEKNAEKAGEKAAAIILKEMIMPSLKKMGIRFDVLFSEKKLYANKEADKAIAGLKKKGLVYEKEGAVWFKTTKFGDDKDRVLIKESGEKTYLASDAAYLKNKIKRGFEVLVMFLGADHYGYVARMKALAEIEGFGKDNLKMIVMQLVRLMKGNEEVRMSKRAGIYITIDELIDEVGLDVVRFFFLTRSPDTHLNFDLDLAKEQSQKNPVYYVQYAHARICAIMKKLKTQNSNLKTSSHFVGQNLKLLNHPAELELIKQLIRLPEIVEDTAEDYQLQRLPQYAVGLADAFHKFYENCHVITEDKKLTEARSSLVSATKIVLKNNLDLMGISVPEKM